MKVDVSCSKQDMVNYLLRDQSHDIKQASVTCMAPTNIALCKYWGKRDQQLHLPCNSSLSVSLGDKGCTTSLSLIDAAQDEVILNKKKLTSDSEFYIKLVTFLDFFRGPQQHHYRVETISNIPIAAGLASSACGFAAMVLALRDLYGWQLNDGDLSILARLGSGSAARSLWQGFVEWRRGERADGLDSQAFPIDVDWPEFEIGILLLDPQQKSVSSRLAMQRTVETSELYRVWPRKAETDFLCIKQALLEKDFDRLAACAENNALLMHATMQNAQPSINYWTEDSLLAMQQVWQCRQQGLPVYFTMDAGPNVKLLFKTQHCQDIQRAFPGLLVVNRNP
ncbi:MAG: diphosphomevalonate decarboxylase [Coxiellaceae bacterium]|nr:diphosphomevalonate decarboxylase [Coxiellaceae bacterium]